MYKKRKRYTKKTYDNKIALLCDQIIEQNPEVYFAVSKKFIENADGSLGDEIEKLPIIISSVSLDKLKIPSSFNLLYGSYLTNWCDNEPLARLTQGSFKFVDGEIKGKKVERLYLDLNYDMKSGEKNHVK